MLKLFDMRRGRAGILAYPLFAFPIFSEKKRGENMRKLISGFKKLLKKDIKYMSLNEFRNPAGLNLRFESPVACKIYR